MFEEADGSYSGKIIDLGLSKEIPKQPSHMAFADYTVNNYPYNRKKHRQVAPEILLGQSDDNEATETYSLGYMFRDLGIEFGIRTLVTLGEMCMKRNPKGRPKMDMIDFSLKDIRRHAI